MVGNSANETNFPHKLLLTNKQVTNFRKAFANHLSADIKLSKTQLSKMQSGGFLNFLRPLTKIALPFLENSAKSLIKNVLLPLGLTVASAADVEIHKKFLGYGHNTTLIISNNEMKNILKIVRYLEDSRLLVEGVSETIKNEGASLSGNMLAGK